MTCNKIQSLLSAYADRELSGVEMFLVRQHVHECEACRLEELEMRRVKSILGDLGVAEPSPGFEDRLISAVMNGRPEPAEAKRLRWASSIATVSLSAAAMLCIAFGVRGTTPDGVSAKPKVSGAGKLSSSSGGSTMAAALQRDSAFINASDPLAGPQIGVAATYARP